jgi:hypothetical protein
MRDIEVGADPAATDAARVSGGSRSIDAAEQLAVAADVADGVDARRAMLTAPLLHLGGERELAAVNELPARAAVRSVEKHAVRRVDGSDRRVLVPQRRQVEDAGVRHLADEAPHSARPFGQLVGRRRVDRSRRREAGRSHGEASNEIPARHGARIILIVPAVVGHDLLPCITDRRLLPREFSNRVEAAAIEVSSTDFARRYAKSHLARKLRQRAALPPCR